jgi:hypothetical protein
MNWRVTITKTAQVVALVLLAALFLVAPLRSQDLDSALTKDQPILKINLRKLGYRNSQRSTVYKTFVNFTDSGRIAVGWVSTGTPEPPHDSPPINEASQLHLLFLDARTGQRMGDQTWPTPARSVSFLGLNDGNFLTCTGNVARLFSPELELIHTTDLPGTSHCANNCSGPSQVVSPDKSRWLICSCIDCSNEWSARKYQYTLIDTNSLAPFSTFLDKRPILAISGHQLADAGNQKNEIVLRMLEESWQALHPVGLGQHFGEFGKNWHENTCSPAFLNDATLLLEAAGSMAVVSIDGKVLFQQQLSRDQFFGDHAVSAEGDKFAVMETRLRGGETLDMEFVTDDRIVVFSLAAHKAIFAVKVPDDSPWNLLLLHQSHTNQMALSPDGKLLAIRSNEVLKIYQLPQSK